jgi:hypothetical protein
MSSQPPPYGPGASPKQLPGRVASQRVQGSGSSRARIVQALSAAADPLEESSPQLPTSEPGARLALAEVASWQARKQERESWLRAAASRERNDSDKYLLSWFLAGAGEGLTDARVGILWGCREDSRFFDQAANRPVAKFSAKVLDGLGPSRPRVDRTVADDSPDGLRVCATVAIAVAKLGRVLSRGEWGGGFEKYGSGGGERPKSIAHRRASCRAGMLGELGIDPNTNPAIADSS